MFVLDINKKGPLKEYLVQQGWLRQDEDILQLSKPGEGNMNYVLRVDTGNRTFIVKQSRSYVEKYPQIPAPANRILIEGAFYLRLRSNPELSEMMPAVIDIDPENNILAMEDLGASRDCSFLYHTDEKLDPNTLQSLVNYLDGLHKSYFKSDGDAEFLNPVMRQLNHEHMYYYPFLIDNGFDLDHITTGLQALAKKYKTDETLKKIIGQVGEVYLKAGQYLLHGDFYPGSWLYTDDGVKIIDPEFCFYGPREFDLAVMKAHLVISQYDEATIENVINTYDTFQDLDIHLLNQMTGIEIMRRIIGLAQLPLLIDISIKEQLLTSAYKMIIK